MLWHSYLHGCVLEDGNKRKSILWSSKKSQKYNSWNYSQMYEDTTIIIISIFLIWNTNQAIFHKHNTKIYLKKFAPYL